MSYEFPAVRAENASVTRSVVPVETDYQKYRPALRYDHWYACAYCSITEAEGKAITFEIDHYEPLALREDLKCEYKNLNYSCDICNGRKSDFWPSESQAQRGMRYFRPDFDDYAANFKLEGVRVKLLTPIAEYTDAMLDMNREGLRELRKVRGEITGSVSEIMEGLRALRGIRVDSVPPHVRARFIALRRELLERAEEIPTEINDLLRMLCKSAYADPDPGKDEWSKRRRAFLRKEGALGADPWRTTHGGVAVAAKKPGAKSAKKSGKHKK